MSIKQRQTNKRLVRALIFMMGFFVFVAQPFIGVANLVADFEYKVTDLDVENDNDSKEKQEKEIGEDESVNNHEIITILKFELVKSKSSSYKQNTCLNFVIEIQIPPPETV